MTVITRKLFKGLNGRIFGFFSCILVLFAQTTLTSFAAPPPGYTLTWADEFNSSRIDTSEWRFREGGSYHSYQQAENVAITDDGLHIAEKTENHGDYHYTGGGVITQRTWKYGYFETRAKMGGRGWHEAFWSTFGQGHNEKPDALLSDAFEIDAFEHDQGGPESARSCGLSFGVIHWLTRHKPASVMRRYPDINSDLSDQFHTYGYECQPGFIQFFIDGHPVGICDMRDFDDISTNSIWLSTVLTHTDAEPGEVIFKYLRVYSADPETQKERCLKAYAELDAMRGKTHSNGIDLWIDAVDFTNPGGWTKDSKDGERALLGHEVKKTVKSESDRYATTRIQVSKPGKYHLWVRSFEATSQPGSRFCNVEIGGKKSLTTFGKGKPGWSWENGGNFDLPSGPLTIGLYDTSAYFARVGRLLLTTDLNFVPDGIGGRADKVEPSSRSTNPEVSP